MGTNYYLEIDNVCSHCGRGDTELHIGKSSAGWVFFLRIYPDEGINSLEDWLPLFGNGTIGDTLSKEEMLEWITELKKDGDVPRGDIYIPGSGYSMSSREFS
jgi:hypothetical protein